MRTLHRTPLAFLLVAGAVSFQQRDARAGNGEISLPIIEKGSTWNFWDRDTRPEGWELPGFEDSSWANGAAELGYGDSDEATPTDSAVATTYFRKSFTIPEGMILLAAEIELKRDDGAIVYINGAEVVRDNMPAGPVGHHDLATSPVGGPNEDAFFPFTLPISQFRTGENDIAVEIHQVTPGSSDLSFDLSLNGLFYEPDGAFGEAYLGAGTEGDPYLIATPDHFLYLSQHPADWDKVFLQVADIDLSAADSDGFGPLGVAKNPFTGTYDGAGRTLSNLDGFRRHGLFGWVDGTLRNITLVNPTVISPSTDRVGGLAGKLDGAAENNHVIGGMIVGRNWVGGYAGELDSATDCSAEGIDVTGEDFVGGLAGSALSIRNCWSSGTVNAVNNAGGLAGGGHDIQFCFSHADAHATESTAGGLIGLFDGSGLGASNCYATGDVRAGVEYAGGLAGLASMVHFDRCFATGTVTIDGESTTHGGIGGFGELWSGGGESNFWDSESSAETAAWGTFSDAPGIADFVGLTTIEAQSDVPYLATGWDFVGEDANGTGDIWRMFPGPADYPHLWWEEVPVSDPDSDSDGMLDVWEIEQFGDLAQDASGDPDEDGFSNLREFIEGSDPNDADSPPRARTETLIASTTTPVTNKFGGSVAISQRTLAVGAPGTGDDAGAVHIFNRTMVERTVTLPEIPADASSLFGKLVISELMYHPEGANDGEFLELLNISGAAFDLDGVQFVAGVSFTFLPGTILPPGGRITLTPEDYSGELSNSGETIRLNDGDGNPILEFFYNDLAPGPTEADGSGPSMVLRMPAANPDANDPANWTTSTAAGGTPGSGDPDAEANPGNIPPTPRWTEVATLDGADATATNFGTEVALDLGTLVVTARGKVIVYQGDPESPTSWTMVTELDTDETEPATTPGIAIHNGTILVRATATSPARPVVLVFETQGESWTHTETLESPEPAATDQFGDSLALHQNTAVAGSAKGTFIFDRHPTTRTWTLAKQITQVTDDEARVSVAIDNHTLVVASQTTNIIGSPILANVYHRLSEPGGFGGDGKGWSRIAQLPAPHDAPGLEHEYDIAIRDGTIVAGSPLSDTAGRIYVYKLRQSRFPKWELDRTLTPTLTPGSRLGAFVDLSGNQIVVGAPNSTGLAGAAYVFPNHERSNYLSWIAHFFAVTVLDDPGVVGISADPDADGLSNQIEFALGLDPTVPNEDEDYLPNTSLGVVGETGKECMTFTFSLPERLPTGLTYKLQVATGLNEWQTVTTRHHPGTWTGEATISEHVGDDGRICATAHDTVEINTMIHRTMRLSVESTE